MSANRAFFILFSLSFIALAGLTLIFIKTVPVLLTHVVYVCQKTFSNVIFTFSHSGPLLLIILMAIILLIGTLTLTVQILRTRRYLKKSLSRKILIPAILGSITQELDLDGNINIVKDNNKFSFCYGLIKPKICLSTGLLNSLTKIELKAVLLHESYHLKNHDPLKILLGKTSSMMFFFIPLIKEIQNYYAFSKEIAADEVAIKYSSKESLLSVLSKLIVVGSPKFSGVAALARADDLEKRILHLTSKQVRTPFKPSLISMFLSVLVVVFSLIIMNTPVYAVSTHEESLEQSLFICPFGDSCDTSCKTAKEVNYSKEELMYTPLMGKQ